MNVKIAGYYRSVNKTIWKTAVEECA